MKDKDHALVFTLVGTIVVAGVAVAQQQGMHQVRVPVPPPINSVSSAKLLSVQSGSATAIQADQKALASYEAITRPINVMEQQVRSLMRGGNTKEAEPLCLRAIAARQQIGDTVACAFDRNLLGEIYMKAGQYEQAINTYLPNYKYTQDASMNLNVALACARLGNYTQAKRFYSDRAILQYSSIKLEDLPGTSNPQSLTASILFAQGLNAFFTGQKQEALTNFEAAAKLAPPNGLIPYYSGMSLLHMGRQSEAAPYFRQAAKTVKGRLGEDARARAAQLR